MEQALYWLVGGLGVPLIQWIKARTGWSGQQAVWLTVAVSAALGIAALFASHQLALADFTPSNLFAVIGQVLAAATLAYKLLLGGQPSPA